MCVHADTVSAVGGWRSNYARSHKACIHPWKICSLLFPYHSKIYNHQMSYAHLTDLNTDYDLTILGIRQSVSALHQICFFLLFGRHICHSDNLKKICQQMHFPAAGTRSFWPFCKRSRNFHPCVRNFYDKILNVFHCNICQFFFSASTRNAKDQSNLCRTLFMKDFFLLHLTLEKNKK